MRIGRADCIATSGGLAWHAMKPMPLDLANHATVPERVPMKSDAARLERLPTRAAAG